MELKHIATSDDSDVVAIVFEQLNFEQSKSPIKAIR